MDDQPKIRIPRDFRQELQSLARDWNDQSPEGFEILYGESSPKDESYIFPTPSLAPQVPPEETVRQIIDHPEHVNPDLVRQVGNSYNCRRTVEQLELEPIHVASGSVETNQLAVDQLPQIKDCASPSSSSAQKENQFEIYLKSKESVFDFDPRKGEVWTTKSRLKGPDGQIFIFLPPIALILGVKEGNSYLAIPCTPACTMPVEHRSSMDAEVKISGFLDLVVHTWLETTVDRSLLEKPIGGMESGWVNIKQARMVVEQADDDLEKFFSAQEEKMPEEGIIQRRQIESCSRYLGCRG